MSNNVFYHAGCPVCVTAEHMVADALSTPVEKVYLGEAKSRVAESEKKGVKSVPALVIDGQVFLSEPMASSVMSRRIWFTTVGRIRQCWRFRTNRLVSESFARRKR